MHFTFQWWAMIFHNARLALVTIRIGNELIANEPVGSMLTTLPVDHVYGAIPRVVWTRQLPFPD